MEQSESDDRTRHQEVAVAMMVEKESGNLQQQNFPSLWSEEVYDVEQKLQVCEMSLLFAVSNTVPGLKTILQETHSSIRPNYALVESLLMYGRSLA